MKKLLVVWFAVQALALAQVSVNITGPNGQVTPLILRDHPRVWFDGPSGAATASIMDPDGSGPLRSLRYNHPVAVALRSRAVSKRGNLNDEANGIQPLLVALGYFMNNQEAFSSDGKSYLQEYRDILNRVREDFYFGGCLYTSNLCGAVYADYAGEAYGRFAMSYTLIRSALTEAERAQFRQMFFNGVADPWCENRLARRPGVVTKVGTAMTISDAAWDPSVKVGVSIAIKRTSAHGESVNWFRVVSFDGTTAVLDKGFPDYPATGTYYTMAPWTPAACGYGNYALSHPNVPGYIVRTESAKLTGAVTATNPNPPAIGGVTDTITIDKSNWLPLGYDGQPVQLPYRIRVTSGYPNTGEIMKVVGVSGNTLTVLRGELDSTIAHKNNAVVLYYSISQFEPSTAAFGLDNRNLTRAQSLLMMAIALADDDPRAVTILEKASAYFYANTYLQAKQHWTLHNNSAVEYGLGRIGAHYPSMVLSFLRSFTTPVDFSAGDYLKNAFGLYNIYWSTAWDNRQFARWGVEAGGNCATEPNAWYTYSTVCLEGPLMLNVLYPNDPITGYMNYQHATRNNFYQLLLAPSKLLSDAAWVEGMPALRYLLAGDYPSWTSTNFTDGALPTSKIWSSGDSTPPGTGLSTFVSRTDWSTSATQLWGLFINSFSDKMNMNDPKSSYMIGKNGWLINNIRAGGEYAPGVGYQQGIDYGFAFKSGNRINKGDLAQTVLGKSGQTDYFYASVDALHTNDNNGNFHHVTRQYRQFAHFKTAPEYIVVYDDVAKSGTPERIRDFIHYPNNGETGDGVTSLDADANFVSSTNKASADAKVITQLMLNGGQVPKVYDLGVTADSASTVITVGKDCTPTSPCRVRSGTSTLSFTDSGTISATGPAYPALAYVYVWLDSAGVRTVGRDANIISVTLSANLADAGVVSGFPGDALVRLARIRIVGTTVFDAQCPGALAANTYTAPREWGSCVGSEARVVFMDAGAASVAEFMAIHRPTSDLGETAVVAENMGSLTPNFRGVYIPASTPTYAIFPKAASKYSALSFTVSHEGAARFLISGLNAGQYNVVKDGSPFSTPTVESDGTYYFTGTAGNYIFTFSSALALTIETADLPPAVISEPYNLSLFAAGGIAPYTWSIASGSLPAGLTLSPQGLLAGTAVLPGQYAVTFQVADGAAPPATASRQLTINVVGDSNLQLLTTSLPSATLAAAYSANLSASGGLPPYTWSVPVGALPAGLTLDSSSGLLSGTPSENGSFSFTAAVTDSSANPKTAQRAFVIVVSSNTAPLEILSETLTAGRFEYFYDFLLQGSGGVGSYTWSLLSGSLPDGLLLYPNGYILGTPMEIGHFVFEVQLTDSSTPPQQTSHQLDLDVTEFGGQLGATVIQTNAHYAIVNYGVKGLQAQKSCSIALYQGGISGSPVETVSDNGGPGIRRAVLGATAALQPETPYTALLTCGSATKEFTLTTTAASPVTGRTLRVTGGAPSAYAATGMTVEYGPTPSLGLAQSGSCGAHCAAQVSLSADSLVYLRRRYLNAQQQVVATSQITPYLVR